MAHAVAFILLQSPDSTIADEPASGDTDADSAGENGDVEREIVR
jgi:hypothetical protein